MQTLIVRPIAVPKIGLGRVDVIKTRGKFFVAATDPKTVTIVVRSIDVVAVGQLDPFFFVARQSGRCESAQQKHNDQYLTEKAFSA